jgi:glycosyltransferase involved in cell wall biosynthesis
MRLLVVTNMWPSRRTPHSGVFVERQVRALRSLGAEVTIAATPRRGGSPAASLAKYGALAWRGWRGARARPQAVLAHYVFPTGAIGLAVGRRARAPVAVVAHGTDVSRHVPRSRLVTRATGAVLRRAHLVVGVSGSVVEDAVALGAPRERTAAIDMGYDESVFFPRPREEARSRLGLPAGKTIALFVGSLVEAKGIGVLLEAAARLRDSRPALSWILVGGGREQGRWEARARAAGLAGTVRFAGPRPPEEVTWWLAAADLVVMPSLREGFGLAALEAMACGLPVVASSTGGLAALIADGETGLLVPAGDAGSLAAAVGRLAAEAGLREPLGAAALAGTSSRGAKARAADLLAALEALVARTRMP